MRAFALVVVLALAGCATQFVATRPDMDNFRRDNYECGIQARTMWMGPLIAAPFLAAAAQAEANRLFRECMEVRGYTITERANP